MFPDGSNDGPNSHCRLASKENRSKNSAQVSSAGRAAIVSDRMWMLIQLFRLLLSPVVAFAMISIFYIFFTIPEPA